MSDSLDTAASGIGIASFAIQIFDKIVQGYQFLSKVSSLPQDHEHLLHRIKVEKYRFDTFCQNIGIAESTVRTPHNAILKETIDRVESLFLEVEQKYQISDRITPGNFTWATSEHEDLQRLVNQLGYYNSQLLDLLEKEEQQRKLDTMYRKQIQAENDLQRLDQLHKALDLTHVFRIRDVNSERHTDETILRKLIMKDREEQIQQRRYLCELISIKEHLQSSLNHFDTGHDFGDIQELPFTDLMIADQNSSYSHCHDDSQQHWIEWRDREMASKHNETRIRLLVHLLQKRKPASFRSPTCIGFTKKSFTDHTIQYGLVLTYPEQMPNARSVAQMSTLRDLLQQKDAEPSLSDRMSFCMVLAECIYDFHTVGWLHKGVRSKNIIFIVQENKAIKFDKPYLIGFESARPDILKDLTVEPQTINKYEEIYRHPNTQASGDYSGYRRSYDLYSLGVVFTEMILWKPIEEVLGWDLSTTKQAKLRQVKDTLCGGEFSRRIAITAGNSFAQVVDCCLRADAIDMQTDDKNTVNMEDFVSQRIVGPLKKLVTALSTME